MLLPEVSPVDFSFTTLAHQEPNECGATNDEEDMH